MNKIDAQPEQKGMYKLGMAMSQRLKEELSDWGKFKFSKGVLLLTMSANHIESELGRLLQQIHQLIDNYFPERQADIPLLIVDDHQKYCLKIKIWHTTK